MTIQNFTNLEKKMKEFIHNIHKSTTQACMAIAGGGAEAIGLLLKFGNGSATLLDAQIPYCQQAFSNYINGIPNGYASESAARNLAMAAYCRALNFNPTKENIVGIGSTASLVKPDGERTGRQHKVFIAAQGRNFTLSHSLILAGYRTREDEESLCSHMILKTLGECANVFWDFEPLSEKDEIKTNKTTPTKNVTDLLNCQELQRLNYFDTPENEHRLIFPGSFDPFHSGHDRMKSAAESFCHMPVEYEISITNVDKLPLDYLSIEERSQQFSSAGNMLWLTNAPKFIQKMKLFPNSTFLMGADTFNRLLNPKYISHTDELAAAVQNYSAKFLICQRLNFQVTNETPDFMEDRISVLSYQDQGESSTKIRKNMQN